jgi:hypothetical protein
LYEMCESRILILEETEKCIRPGLDCVLSP